MPQPESQGDEISGGILVGLTKIEINGAGTKIHIGILTICI